MYTSIAYDIGNSNLETLPVNLTFVVLVNITEDIKHHFLYAHCLAFASVSKTKTLVLFVI